MSELTKVKKSVIEESQVLPDMEGQSGKVLSNDGSKPRWIEIDNEWQPGDIKMFAGSESQIQAGWQLCNGVGQTSNGINIPDLRDRFIIGSGGAYSTGSKGGSTSSTTSSSGSHSHTVSINGHTLSESQLASHRHLQVGGGWQNGGASGAYGDGGNHNTGTSYTGGNAAHSHGGSCASSGSHNHTVSTLPPYYALAFIIKL